MLTATKVACPNCTRAIKLAPTAAVGKRLRCPQCGCPFTVSARDVGAAGTLVQPAAPPTMALRSPPPLPFVSAPIVEPPKRGLLLLGMVAGILLLLGGAIGLAVYFANRDAPEARQAAADPKKDDKANATVQDPPARGVGSPERTVRPTDYEPPSPKPMADPVTPVSIEPPVATRTTLAEDEQQKVNRAIERGVDYLKIHQTAAGTWNGGAAGQHSLGLTALPALTLLECGVPADDHFVQRAAGYVRAHAPRSTWTYDIALSILFLDRLGNRQDEALIRSLGLRLLAGQTTAGGWHYTCPIVDLKYEPSLLLVLEQTRPRNPLELFVTGNDGKANLGLIGIDEKVQLPPGLIGIASQLDPDGPFRGVVDGVSKLRPDVSRSNPPNPGGSPPPTQAEKNAARKALGDLPKNLQRIPSLLPPSALKELPRSDNSDNSNTQFAILGVLAATQHGVPTDRAMGLLVQRFRVSQNADGTFGYQYRRGGGASGNPATMTGAGLLGLAVTHGLTAGLKLEGMAAKGIQDKNIQKALTALSRFIERPLGKGVTAKGRSPINLYFLWTVERVGMLYGLPKINDKDWYRWGAEALLNTQVKDGSWTVGGYHAATPTTDTSFALLFLKRANLAKDLTIKIQSKLELIIEDK